MGRYDAKAHDVAKHMFEQLPRRVRREKGREFHKLLRKRSIGGVRHIGNRKQAEQVANTIIDFASEHEHFSDRKERHLRRKIERGRTRDMRKVLGIEETQEKASAEAGEGRTRGGHMKPPSAIDGKQDRIADLRRQINSPGENDVHALRQALQADETITEDEKNLVLHQARMRNLVRQAHGWRKKEGEEEEEEEKRKRQSGGLGTDKKEAAEELTHRQAVRKPPETHES